MIGGGLLVALFSFEPTAPGLPNFSELSGLPSQLGQLVSPATLATIFLNERGRPYYAQSIQRMVDRQRPRKAANSRRRSARDPG